MMKPGNPKLRMLYTVWAFLECLGFGGLLYGWGSLVYVLKDEGLYLDLCDNANELTATNNSAPPGYTDVTGQENISVVIIPTGPDPSETLPPEGCPARDDKLNLVFTIGSAMFCVCCFIMGQVNFKFGTRISRLGALVMFIVGALCIAFTSNDVPWLIFPGLSLLGGGGITYLMTNFQISALFPVQGSAVIGLLCGGFDASSGIQLMVKLGYEGGISRKTSYLILAACHLLTLISTFLFLPKDFIKKVETPKRNAHVALPLDDEAAVELSNDMEKKALEEESTGPTKSLVSCILSPIYILHVLWLSILQLRFYFLLGSLNKMLEDLSDNDKDQVSYYTNVSMYIMMGGLFTSPFAGFVYGFQNRFFENSESALRRSLMPAVLPLMITTTLCLIMSFLVLVQDPMVLYGVFITLLFFRSFLYTMAAGFLGAIFPGEYFGLMYGLLILIGGIISFFQNLLFQWSDSAGFETVNYFLLVLVAITYGHPLFQWWTAHRAECRRSL